MFTTAQVPGAGNVLLDDAETPGTYVIDGERLLRLLGSGEPRRGYVGIEDCISLEVVFVRNEELRAWDLTPVCGCALAMAA